MAIGIASFLTPKPLSAADDEKTGTSTFQVYKDKSEKYRWRLVTQNKNVIATSGQGYADKRGCLAGIESIKKNAASAKVEEVAAPEHDHADHK
jgi:uncharacterized protein YegP (UPF0339 family)